MLPARPLRVRLVTATAAGLLLLTAAGCRGGGTPPSTGPASAGLSTAAPADGSVIKPGWLYSWSAAVAKSQELGKPILVNFSKSAGCPTCGGLDQEVFLQPAFQEWASQNVVLLELDFSAAKPPVPENLELAKRLGVIGYPTVVLADAAGKPLGELRLEPGGVAAFTKKAGELLAGEEPPGLPWLHSYPEAVAQANKSGKLIMMDFTGSDWCVFCHKLRDEVFRTEEFRQWSQQFVLLELDYPRNLELTPELSVQNEQLLAKYQVQGFPKILFIDPAGEVKASLGYVEGGPKVWITEAEKGLATAQTAAKAPATAAAKAP